MTEQSLPHREIPFRGEIIKPELLEAVRSAGYLALQVQEGGISSIVKSTKEDIVTEGDKLVTDQLKPAIQTLFPGCSFVDEETDSSHDFDFSKNEGLVAVMDPIDGTTNYFIASQETNKHERNPNWGVSVGFVKGQEVVGGIIFQPQTGNIYYAEKGKGAYLNGKKLQIKPSSSNRIRLIYSPPYPKDEKEFKASANAIAALENTGITTTKLGSAVIETMQVAEGKQDVFIHFKTKPWDVAAAISIVQEAGGKCADASGNDYQLFGDNILLANPKTNTETIIQIASKKLEEMDRG